MIDKRLPLAAACLALGASTGVVWASECAPLEPHTVALMMSEPSMVVDGAYHELLDGTYLKPYLKDKEVMAVLTDMLDELYGEAKADGKTVVYTLNGHSVTMSAGSVEAKVDGKDVKAPVAPEIVEGEIFAPVRFVFKELGGEWAWDKARERAVISILVPKGSVYELSEGTVNLRTALQQKPEWYAGDEARKAADGLLGMQNADGGWFKLTSGADFAAKVDRDGFAAYRQKSTIDNDTTMVQLRFLGRVYNATKADAYKDAVVRGIEYILKGQYANGGWPQFFPVTVGYHKRITFNDDAVANVSEVLLDVAAKTAEFGFVSDELAARAKAACDKALALVLKTQVVMDGKKTAWCAQYDETTLECAKGRSYELASVSGSESVNILRFLMSFKAPTKEVVEAVNAAIAYLQSMRIDGKKIVQKDDPSLEFGFNRVLADDPKAKPLWPRFIEIGTNKTLFSNRAGDKLYAYEDVSYERRNRYSWLVTTPQSLLEKDYPAWQKEHSPGVNALAK